MLLIAVFTSWVLLTLLLLYRGRLRQAASVLRRHWLSSLRYALINPVCYYLILFQAYDLLPAQQAQSINYTWAITMSLLAVPLLGHSLSLRDMAALLLAYSGVLVIATRGDILALAFDSVSGVLLALLSTLLWALYWILNTRDSQRHQGSDSTVAMWGGFTLATPVLLGIALATDPWPSWHLAQVQQGLLAAIYIGVFEMGITFLLWQQAMNLTRRTAAISSLIFLSPFLSLIFISQLLGEAIAPATVVGLLFIIAGLGLQKLPLRGDRKKVTEPD
tara:strand:+ start:753 stop:1580 length:828 start_codon:yes stop_codon:yes gene_type:complete